MTTYIVGIDFDSDGAFTDISADVLALDWRLGLAAPYESAAAPSAARITVRSPAGAYSPERTPLYPGTPVRIQSADGAAVRTHFTGLVRSVEPQPGDQGARTAVIHARGLEFDLDECRIRLPPLVNTRADAVIAAALDAAPLRRPVLKGRWLVGRAGHSELGTNTRLPGLALPRSLETGKTALAYVGDTWGDGIPAGEAVRQAAEAERGRFFISRQGTAVFYNRHHLLKDRTPQAVFADDMDGLAYSYGAGLVSRVRVRFSPRVVGAAESELWALGEPHRLPPGFSRIIARFVESDGRPMGALEVLPPARGVDFSASSAADGSGANLSDQVTVMLRAAGFSAAELDIHNRAVGPVYLWARLRGTPLYQGDPLVVERVNLYGQAVYGLESLDFNLPALDSAAQADQLARYELARRNLPRGVAASLTLSSPAHRPHILARTLFDRITIREAQTGQDADYFIVAEAHRVGLGGARHEVTWTLESAEANAFWLLGVSRLGRDTVVAY